MAWHRFPSQLLVNLISIRGKADPPRSQLRAEWVVTHFTRQLPIWDLATVWWMVTLLDVLKDHHAGTDPILKKMDYRTSSAVIQHLSSYQELMPLIRQSKMTR